MATTETTTEYEICAHCGRRIFANRLGTYSHVGNTTANPSVCYVDGTQRLARPVWTTTIYTPSGNFAAMATHDAGDCEACAIAIANAVALARTTGSVEARHVDGLHAAVVTRTNK